ncbi:MAG: hypothetical protein OEY50_06290, partial [Nitrospinota bacterium]|nr:hypothetical protein [Nitrospinota bacterium]
GRIKSSSTVLFEMYRAVRQAARQTRAGGNIICSASPEVAELLMEEEPSYLEGMESKLGVKIVINTDVNMHQEKFHVWVE